MKKKHLFWLLLLPFFVSSCATSKTPLTLKVLQINAWHQATAVPDAFSGLVSIINQTDPDIVLLSEVRGGNTNFIPQLLDSLKALNKTYYGEVSHESAGLISKYKIEENIKCCPSKVQGFMIKSRITVGGKTIIAYSSHLDYKHYECYLPRGYSGTTWKKLDAPVLDADSILRANRMSERNETITAFIEDAKQEIEKGNLVLLGGDFNEPSHLDWQADTKDLRDHNGMIINWDCSLMLTQMGMKDTYRELYPDAVKYPGITYPSANPSAETAKLTWAPEADERDRIDFIYYYPNPSWKLKQAVIVGPQETIRFGKVQEKDASDPFIVPTGIWPTDHKANLATFVIKKNKKQ
ncbi:endonuclease/exonuclease/phosphatase family protein [Bacteroides sp. 224]|uniref:endonuclease/exonuclease/phosphatase family protein n=1 Tax=Bacteroides sp. 224 TaxID=2302936 RepID=UPI0013D04BA3|nr:endonuclease/exonuclease/phosphatase family protein [Bacteroides sp. 224]NDV64061.1 endonuclease/exonuclease/phosphatase family protein [Bacteroides sp. 224]